MSQEFQNKMYHRGKLKIFDLMDILQGSEYASGISTDRTRLQLPQR